MRSWRESIRQTEGFQELLKQVDAGQWPVAVSIWGEGQLWNLLEAWTGTRHLSPCFPVCTTGSRPGHDPFWFLQIYTERTPRTQKTRSRPPNHGDKANKRAASTWGQFLQSKRLMEKQSVCAHKISTFVHLKLAQCYVSSVSQQTWKKTNGRWSVMRRYSVLSLALFWKVALRLPNI